MGDKSRPLSENKKKGKTKSDTAERTVYKQLTTEAKLTLAIRKQMRSETYWQFFLSFRYWMIDIYCACLSMCQHHGIVIFWTYCLVFVLAAAVSSMSATTTYSTRLYITSLSICLWTFYLVGSDFEYEFQALVSYDPDNYFALAKRSETCCKLYSYHLPQLASFSLDTPKSISLSDLCATDCVVEHRRQRF